MKKQNKVKFSLSQGLIENENIQMYEGKEVPDWLQQPVYEERTAEKKDEIPAWVLKPVNFEK